MSELRDIKPYRIEFDNIENHSNKYGFVIGQCYEVKTGGLTGEIEIAGIASNGCYYYVNKILFGCTNNGSFQFGSMIHESLQIIKNK
jgi:hypothetical protein